MCVWKELKRNLIILFDCREKIREKLSVSNNVAYAFKNVGLVGVNLLD